MPFTAPKPLEPLPEELVGSAVLVVDDEHAWRLILETDLTMLGYRVAVARDAAEALRLARERRPDIAIIDLMLPGPVDGLGLLRELRAQGTPMPVIFYTAYPVLPDHACQPEVIGCISKAAERADLYAQLPPAIRRGKTSRR